MFVSFSNIRKNWQNYLNAVIKINFIFYGIGFVSIDQIRKEMLLEIREKYFLLIDDETLLDYKIFFFLSR